jgi:hypothetical protein
LEAASWKKGKGSVKMPFEIEKYNIFTVIFSTAQQATIVSISKNTIFIFTHGSNFKIPI